MRAKHAGDSEYRAQPRRIVQKNPCGVEGQSRIRLYSIIVITDTSVTIPTVHVFT